MTDTEAGTRLTAPRTEAGRAHVEKWWPNGLYDRERLEVEPEVRAIEDEAARPATDPAGLTVPLIDALVATIRRDDLCDDTDGEHHTDEFVTAFLLSLDAELRARAALAENATDHRSRHERYGHPAPVVTGPACITVHAGHLLNLRHSTDTEP